MDQWRQLRIQIQNGAVMIKRNCYSVMIQLLFEAIKKVLFKKKLCCWLNIPDNLLESNMDKWRQFSILIQNGTFSNKYVRNVQMISKISDLDSNPSVFRIQWSGGWHILTQDGGTKIF